MRTKKPKSEASLLKEKILASLGDVDSQSPIHKLARVKLILRIYEYQTDDEKQYCGTMYYNGVGFTGTDSGILSSFCEQLEKYGYLSDKQHAIINKKCRKYAGQMAKLVIHDPKSHKVENNIAYIVKKDKSFNDLKVMKA